MGDAESVAEYGKVLKYLPAIQIAKCLALRSSEGYLNPFVRLEKESETFQNTALAYLNIYFDLYHALSKEDFGLIASQLLLKTGGYFVMDDLISNRHRIIDRYAELWELVNENQLTEYLIPSLEQACMSIHQIKSNMFVSVDVFDLESALIETLDDKDLQTLAAFGNLIKIMGLNTDRRFILKLIPKDLNDVTDIFLRYFSRGFAAQIDAYCDLLKPGSASPTISLMLDNIEVARQKFLKLGSSLNTVSLIGSLIPALNKLTAAKGLQLLPP